MPGTAHPSVLRGPMLASENRQIFAQIEQFVAACPGAQLVRGVHTMRVLAGKPSGFQLSLALDDRHCTLTFDQWSMPFPRNDQTALELFELALHGDVRIRVDAIGARPWRWTLERRTPDGVWQTEQSMGGLKLRFWGRKSVAFLRNDFGFQAWPPEEKPSEAAA